MAFSQYPRAAYDFSTSIERPKLDAKLTRDSNPIEAPRPEAPRLHLAKLVSTNTSANPALPIAPESSPSCRRPAPSFCTVAQAIPATWMAKNPKKVGCVTCNLVTCESLNHTHDNLTPASLKPSSYTSKRFLNYGGG